MTDPVFTYPMSTVPSHRHGAFLESVKNSMLVAVREALLSGASPGLLDVAATVEDGKIKIRVVDLRPGGGSGVSSDGDEEAFFNDKTPDEFYNTVNEDEFMSRVMTAAQTVTPRLYEMFLDAERAFR